MEYSGIILLLILFIVYVSIFPKRVIDKQLILTSQLNNRFSDRIKILAFSKNNVNGENINKSTLKNNKSDDKIQKKNISEKEIKTSGKNITRKAEGFRQEKSHLDKTNRKQKLTYYRNNLIRRRKAATRKRLVFSVFLLMILFTLVSLSRFSVISYWYSLAPCVILFFNILSSVYNSRKINKICQKIDEKIQTLSNNVTNTQNTVTKHKINKEHKEKYVEKPQEHYIQTPTLEKYLDVSKSELNTKHYQQNQKKAHNLNDKQQKDFRVVDFDLVNANGVAYASGRIKGVDKIIENAEVTGKIKESSHNSDGQEKTEETINNLADGERITKLASSLNKGHVLNSNVINQDSRRDMRIQTRSWSIREIPKPIYNLKRNADPRTVHIDTDINPIFSKENYISPNNTLRPKELKKYRKEGQTFDAEHEFDVDEIITNRINGVG